MSDRAVVGVVMVVIFFLYFDFRALFDCFGASCFYYDACRLASLRRWQRAWEGLVVCGNRLVRVQGE